MHFPRFKFMRLDFLGLSFMVRLLPISLASVLFLTTVPRCTPRSGTADGALPRLSPPSRSRFI